jgi:OPT family oligopeptide transporter
MAAMTLAVALAWPTQLSWWALLICLLIAACYIVPFGIISSITTITIGLNVLTEFVIGYLQPGKPIAMMLFKTYGYITMSQALTFTGDIKLAHYMKVPQRKLFWVQLIATFVGATVDVAAVRLAMSSIPGICTRNAFMRFNCPQARVFFTASM